MNDARTEGTRGRTMLHATRTLSLMTLLLLPLVIGARDCERVVVGEECDGAPCTPVPDGGAGGAGGGCFYAGMRRAVNESFPSEDGCNSCSCGADGQVACTLRACDNSCGGLLGRACSQPNQYCKYAEAAQCGAADQTGICTARPQGCREIYQPVCGCDGKTYGNDCEAAVAGTSVATKGECAGGGEPGTTCGGLLGQPCARSQYCNFPPDAMCGRADATGTCAAIPQACTLEYSPVCGCDGKTYGNACGAAAAGVSVETRGECGGTAPVGQSCGSRGQAACPSGQYCNFPLDAECGATDRPGICADVPQACTREYTPVCGCDGMTYGNPCTAAAAGTSIAARGECAGGGSGDTCGGIAGLGCPAGEYCNYPVSALCGAADQTGTCAAIPQACDAIYQPVCGCDDKTYGNACEAALMSVSVAASGECGGGTGKICGGFIGAQCAASEYCDYPASAFCGRADASGTCKPRPDACIEVEMPVCGCDGTTYGNSCKAAMKGVGVLSDGACN